MESTPRADVRRQAANDPHAGLSRLTPAERKVLQGVNLGLPNKQIAWDLGIAEATVKAHMTALMRKLKVQNRTQAATMARAMSLGCAVSSD
ncbi:LuxR family transcriptional regulator [Caulobacter sp. Root655]|uniref:helix-turn-helix domain-containing protein n=1 Tax=Caulobacter sp. Root655 TaxID=1736578 RepID=UPI0006F49147|nr:LuxR C-terminal-related transcriptional regulator [Caulobacter sp. Root655]KRA58331.1 LuxR family transcriptional regulator [Caulobacter sp. Root655]